LERLRVEDQRSTNGTFVNGVRVELAVLRGGEMVQLGATLLLVEPIHGQPVSLSTATSFGEVIGVSPAMRQLYPMCHKLARSDVPVVIEGETGVGKEQLAEAIHALGSRANGPLVVFDCTAVAPNLIESELFGHERGAFTGSVTQHKGVFERAHNGTLLIDEIGDLPMSLQAKLLRAIERRSVTRVGGSAVLSVDVRLLSATRRDLDREVQLGNFRDDLFHRIAVTRIEVPPLRDRRGDVTVLARHFCRELGGEERLLPAELLQRWDQHIWPGNVRELKNAVARWLALGDVRDSTIPPPDPQGRRGRRGHPLANHGDSIARVLAAELPWAEARQAVLDELEGRYVEHMLGTHGGNMTRAAAAAGVARRHFYRMKTRALGEPEPQNRKS
jgi:DNA-binding NtrC family response regulator